MKKLILLLLLVTALVTSCSDKGVYVVSLARESYDSGYKYYYEVGSNSTIQLNSNTKYCVGDTIIIK